MSVSAAMLLNNKRVILDTNMLMVIRQFGIDVISEVDRLVDDTYKVYILDETIVELKKLAEEEKGNNKTAAKIALQVIEKNKLNIMDTKPLQQRLQKKHVDDLLLAIARAQPHQTIVATQDQELKSKLKKAGISLIVLKGKSHLDLV